MSWGKAKTSLELERERIEFERDRREWERGPQPLDPAEDDTPPERALVEAPQLYRCASPLCPGQPDERPWGGRHSHCIRIDRMAARGDA